MPVEIPKKNASHLEMLDVEDTKSDQYADRSLQDMSESDRTPMSESRQ